jgi:hypothetical protein
VRTRRVDALQVFTQLSGGEGATGRLAEVQEPVPSGSSWDMLARNSDLCRLNAIIGFSEVLSEGMFGELNEKQEEYLKDIYASGTHCCP